MGLRLEEVGFQYAGAFRDIFEEYKRYHNIAVKRQTFSLDTQEAEIASVEDVLR